MKKTFGFSSLSAITEVASFGDGFVARQPSSTLGTSPSELMGRHTIFTLTNLVNYDRCARPGMLGCVLDVYAPLFEVTQYSFDAVSPLSLALPDRTASRDNFKIVRTLPHVPPA